MKEWSKAEIEMLELKCTEGGLLVTKYIDDVYSCEDPNCPLTKDNGKHNHWSFS